jgi:urease accessory protein
MHPILGWDHLLAMVAVGLWAAQRGGRAVWILPVSFVGVMALGGIMGTSGIDLPGVETGILASVLVLGILIAAAARFPIAIGAAVVAIFALFHGHAHGTEMPQTSLGIAYSIGFCTATALLHASGIALPNALRKFSAAEQGRWIRYAGAGLGLAGVALILAWAMRKNLPQPSGTRPEESGRKEIR